MEYDTRDKAIFEVLYHNWRISSSEIGRKTRLSRRKVDYRIKQYFSQGMIRSIFTVFNYAKLGYTRPAYAFISLVNKRELAKIGTYLEKTKRCTSWGRVWTEYDLFSNFIFKDKREMSSCFRKLKSIFRNKIREIVIIKPTEAELYPLKFFGNSVKDSYRLVEKSRELYVLDILDKEIMKEIASNAQKPVIDIARKLKISPERCLYRMRKLFKEKVILGSRIQFGLRKAGYFATCLFINSKINDTISNSVKMLCKEDGNINYLILENTYPQIIIQVFHKNEETLHTILKKINDELKEDLYRISIIRIEDDINLVNPLPFL
jgi:Lrp/AsnC family transcriptional regulator for asnA, asnC and gidA